MKTYGKMKGYPNGYKCVGKPGSGELKTPEPNDGTKKGSAQAGASKKGRLGKRGKTSPSMY